MIESIGINLVATGLACGGGIGLDRVRKALLEKKYSNDVSEFTTIFTNVLKKNIEDSFEEDARIDLATDDIDWTAIAEAMGSRTVRFETETEAIVRISTGIGAGLPVDYDSNPSVRNAVETAVTDAFRCIIREFTERIAGTELAEQFTMETAIDLSTAAESIMNRLKEIERDLRRHRITSLGNAGFVRLDQLYFERTEPGDPEKAWRTGFTLADVSAGYALTRRRPSDTDDDRTIAEDVYGRLSSGEHIVVLGEGGTGKSTTCKQVACRWYEDEETGSVYYRSSTTTTSFETPATLLKSIRSETEPVLVVVEDATSGSASTIFEVLAAVNDSDNVTFLFDARYGEWEAASDIGRHATFEQHRHELSVVEIPPFDERECQRAIDKFESLTERPVNRTPSQLHTEIQDADIGGPLVVAYRLTGPSIDTDRPVSALHSDVIQAYERIREFADGRDLPQTVAVMVNVLNAAGLPVDSALVHALAQDRDDHRTIDNTLSFLEGIALETEGQSYRTPHQLWSSLYLERTLEEAGERIASDRFERSIEALFRVIDSPERREQIRRWERSDSELFEGIESSPEVSADRYLEQIATIGRSHPPLGTLYGTPKMWRVTLPKQCSVLGSVRWYISRGNIHLDRGAFEAARAEFDCAEEIITGATDELSEAERRRARIFGKRGVVAQLKGDLEAAEEWYEKSLTIQEKLDIPIDRARSITNLGVVIYQQGDLSAAKERYEEALSVQRSIDNKRGQARCLSGLGLIAAERGYFDEAEEYHETALSKHRQIEGHHDETRTLSTPRMVSTERENLESTKVFNEAWLSTQHGSNENFNKAESLSNRGLVALRRERYDEAREYLERALAVRRDSGDRHGGAKTLGNLGVVASERDNLSVAEQYHREAIAIKREIGDQPGRARSLGNLGVVAFKRGALDKAEAYHESALSIHQEVDDGYGIARSFTNLGIIAAERDDLSTAKRYHEMALEVNEEKGRRHRKAHSLCDIARIERSEGDLITARERFEAAREIFKDDDLAQCVFIGLRDLVEICWTLDDIESAKEWCREGIELSTGRGAEPRKEWFVDQREKLQE
ncbi:tetratricopeptide repeat protein [Halocatena salina]|uniref:Tetratricopeptide repeat protein n=1 Tax=Halocatena salina TaxID=2934340 RepID=A0A8U0A885_9EURY|nr:tetratricopeptide repeat protein [Halocatena salina]UPM45345.1 tetratricopeptide repeat protein [Halocatena salina]